MSLKNFANNICGGCPLPDFQVWNLPCCRYSATAWKNANEDFLNNINDDNFQFKCWMTVYKNNAIL